MAAARMEVGTISFLIGSFRSTITTFGENSKSVRFFKAQVEELMKIGQVKGLEANLVYRLLGMENTDSVKWDSTNEKLKGFIEVMQYMSNANTEEDARNIYQQLRASAMIPSNIDSYIREIYPIKETVLPTKKESFGAFNAGDSLAKPSGSTATTIRMGKGTTIGTGKANSVSTPRTTGKRAIAYTYDTFCKELETFTNFANNRERMGIRVYNPNAACQSDTSYYQCKLNDFLAYAYGETGVEGCYRCLDVDKHKPRYEIGKLYEAVHGCSTYTEVKDDAEVMRYAELIDFKRFSQYNKKLQSLRIDKLPKDDKIQLFNVVKFIMNNQSSMMCMEVDGVEQSTLLRENFDEERHVRMGVEILSNGSKGIVMQKELENGMYIVNKKLTEEARKLNWKLFFESTLRQLSRKNK